MKTATDPAAYEAWYHTPRGRWISDCEFSLLQDLLDPKAGGSLLDVGCGTGHFSRRFARVDLSVTGIDPDPQVLAFALQQDGDISYLLGSVLNLPFPADSFDYTAAITSLCFIAEPLAALQEIWRVTRHTLVLGLLNQQSLLYRQKQGRGSYREARWDRVQEVRQGWMPMLTPAPEDVRILSTVYFPQGNMLARWAEEWIPNRLPLGGFIAVALSKC